MTDVSFVFCACIPLSSEGDGNDCDDGEDNKGCNNDDEVSLLLLLFLLLSSFAFSSSFSLEELDDEEALVFFLTVTADLSVSVDDSDDEEDFLRVPFPLLLVCNFKGTPVSCFPVFLADESFAILCSTSFPNFSCNGDLSLLVPSALATRDTVPFTFECEFDGPDSSVDSEDDSVELDDDDSVEL